jgi:AcrR family transcriptional regulator
VATKRKPAKKRVRQQIKSFARAAYCQAILDAGESVFSRLGYHQAKMSDVAAAAGVSIGTLYNHFRSKELIFNSLIERGSGRFIAAVKEAATIAGPERRLREIVRTALAFIEERGVLFAVYSQLGAYSETDIARVGGTTRSKPTSVSANAVSRPGASRARREGAHGRPRAPAAALAGSMNAPIRMDAEGRTRSLTIAPTDPSAVSRRSGPR